MVRLLVHEELLDKLGEESVVHLLLAILGDEIVGLAR